jgi:hypothetical protein
VDNTARETYSDDYFQEGLNMTLNKIPGLHLLLKKKVDLYGRDAVIYQNKDDGIMAPLQRISDIFLNPTFVTRKTNDPVTSELLLLSTETGETDFFPTVAPKKVTIGGVGKDMSPDEYDRWSTNSGSNIRANYEAMMESPEWGTMSAMDRAANLKGVLDEVKNSVKMEFIENRLAKLLKNNGQAAADAFMSSLSDSEYENYMKWRSAVGGQ